MKEENMTPETLAGELANSLRDDAEAEKEFRANPTKFVEERFDCKVPADARIEIHDNTEKVWHVPLPASGKSSVSDASLGDVAGGLDAKGNPFVLGIMAMVNVATSAAGVSNPKSQGGKKSLLGAFSRKKGQ